ncbi:Uncharacterised protein [Mycobacterium tuberculosis]|nr:Uncharacterised protein [Mycobacterium tuberculosis]CFS17371.1 Uncharacterised protein [Mycobacterium tuberculosis]CNU95013.1 Uncharacterised protein [Mycobacterium tuberculosis]CNV25740.1 Uncharacterised protein [Mycobacterium tuberculosis]CNV79411.1 Uncharacterised protein [Mycobacterium tuberculosis]
MAQIVTQGRIQRAAQRVVLGWQHTVFAVVAAELGKKGHRFLGALRHQLAVHPVQRLPESGSLGAHVGWEQVAYRGVEGKPMGIEAADQFRVVELEGVLQHPQRVPVLEAHGPRF